ncbi:hypothetical protein [Blastococcus sp. TF02A-26]|uniref:hypothetical protein n=1 Tax=Blastococcus sp. TF02A-26 TaxID=2250577 RepID=UPI0011BEA7CC|nr:hypothetical protein [Blastococcus sp. TF02A-26]
MRAVVRLLTILGIVATAVVTPTVGSTPAGTAEAADLRLFEAGNIISDAVFFDGWAMDANAIQAFLATKGAGCRAGQMPCLKDFGQATANQSADAMCDGYTGAAWESAATIIAKVARSCGINPRVLLVLLQKEQSLVTRTEPTSYAYEKATGFACPDTAPCNPAFVGFVSQVYFAARQFERYRVEAHRYNYKAGRMNTIQWHPDRDRCGTSEVFIANQATAGLYNYTPYRPNQAALDAGTRTGDSCSSYGNRNFYNYFTDWFGTTGAITVPGGIGAVWEAEGGGPGYLGYPVGHQFCGLVRSGCGQHFQGGSIYWSPATQPLPVSGAMRAVWAAQGWETGFGYPTTRMDCSLPGGGCGQHFEGGLVLWTEATAAHALNRAVKGAWDAAGGLGGPGYPTGDLVCGMAEGGCRQQFQNATIYTSPAGAGAISGGIGGFWQAQGAERSWLGYPTGAQICSAEGCHQPFQRGTIGWTPANGVQVTDGAIGGLWARLGYGASAVGNPIGAMTCGLADGGCRQLFQKGAIYWSAGTGAASVSGAIGTWWTGQGADTAAVGYPTGEMVCVAGGCRQDFRTATATHTAAAGVRLTNGAIGGYWYGQGAGTSSLGYPAADMTCAMPAGGCRQDFQHGAVYWSPPSGTHGVTGAIAQHLVDQGGPAGALGYPVGEVACGLASSGCRQPFQGGTAYWSPGTGAWGVFGGIAGHWAGLGAERSSLGYPTSAMACVAGGCHQSFQGGWLGWSPAAGVRVTSGAIAGLWQLQGGGSGGLGEPVDDMFCGLTGGGCRQSFQGGTIYWSAAGGAHTVAGGIGGHWHALGAERSALGYPTGEIVCTANGCSQSFQNGQLGWSDSAGVRSVTGGINIYWAGQGGVGGALGAPLTEASCSTGCSQTFRNGVVAWSPTTGTFAVTGPIRTAWSAAGGGSGSLGYPLADAYPVPGGTAQDFQRGRLTLDTASGTVTRS